MQTHNTLGRWLARIAGLAATTAALAILCQDGIATGHWSLDHALMPVTVGITILSGHLVGSALRSWRIGSAVGFALLFVIGTGLTVYTSVGRQAKTADTEVAVAEASNAAIAAANAELTRSRRRLADAESMVERETSKGGCKNICQDWQRRAREVRSDIAAQEKALGSMGPTQPVAPRADRAAEVLALAGIDKAKAKRAFMMFEPFAFSLFFELAAIVAFGFGFSGTRKAKAPRVEITPEPGPALVAQPATVPQAQRRDSVHSFVAAHIARHGRPPQIAEVQTMHQGTYGVELPKSTAARWRTEAMQTVEPVRRLRIVG